MFLFLVFTSEFETWNTSIHSVLNQSGGGKWRRELTRVDRKTTSSTTWRLRSRRSKCATANHTDTSTTDAHQWLMFVVKGRGRGFMVDITWYGLQSVALWWLNFPLTLVWLHCRPTSMFVLLSTKSDTSEVWGKSEFSSWNYDLAVDLNRNS